MRSSASVPLAEQRPQLLLQDTGALSSHEFSLTGNDITNGLRLSCIPSGQLIADLLLENSLWFEDAGFELSRSVPTPVFSMSARAACFVIFPDLCCKTAEKRCAVVLTS